jgi:hypothetical protein
MGAVYRASHPELGTVALKMMRPDEGNQINVHRFRREVGVQAQLGDHPHVVRVLDPGGEAEGFLYFAMEYLPGGALDEACKQLGLRDRVTALAQAARGVGHAHAHGVAHRDLKPQNVLLDAEGRAQVTDFGLAKGELGKTRLTHTGVLVGTPLYMSPEHVGSEQEIGPTSDVFSLGTMLYELATEAPPFMAENFAELCVKVADAKPAPFSEHGVHAPPLEAIARKALHPDPRLRYATASELDRYLAGEAPAASASSESVNRVVLTLADRWRWIVALIAALIAAIGLVLVLKRVTAESERRRAEAEERVALEALAKQLQGATDPQALERALTEGAARLPLGAPPAKLRAALAEGSLRRAALHAEARRRPEARRGLACIDSALAFGADPLAAATLRLELAAQLDPTPIGALEELRAVDPAHPTLALWEARAQLWRGEAQLALRRIEAALDAPGEEEGRLQLLRSAAAFHQGYEDTGYEALNAARAAGLPADEELHLWLEVERLDRARAVLEAMAARGPLTADQAALLNRLCLSAGRPDRARDALFRSGAADASDPRLRVELLRAKSYLGEDVRAPLEAIDHPAAELLRRDLRAAAEGAGAYADLSDAAQETPAGRAVLARAVAKSDPVRARALLHELLGAAEEETLGRPMTVAGARALRDLAYAANALQDPESSQRAFRCLGRADVLPDLDRRRLAVFGDPSAAKRLRGEVLTEGPALDGPLGRGLVLACVSRRWEVPALAEEARRLLLARAAGRPTLRPLLGVLRAPLPVGWSNLLPASLAKPRGSHGRHLATAIRRRALRLPDDSPKRAELLEQALRGGDAEAGRLLLDAVQDAEPSWEGFSLWVDYLRARPRAAFLLLQRLPDPKSLSRRSTDDVIHQVLSAAGWLHGLLRREPEEWGFEADALIGVLDGIVYNDPSLVGLLYLRAHVLQLQGHRRRAERDLAVLAQLPHARPDDPFWDGIYRAWIASRQDPQAAVKALPDRPSPLSPLESEAIARWRRHTGPRRLRARDAFGRWGEGLTEAPPAPPLGDEILRLDFDGDVLGRPGGGPLRSPGTKFVPGRGGRGQALSVARSGGLLYRGEAFDPSEGTFMAWVRPNWRPKPGLGKRPNPDPNHYLFAFQPRPWRSELRLWSWQRRVFGARSHAPLPSQGASHITAEARGGLAAGRWTHVVLTWSASAGNLSLYMDGAPASERTGWTPPLLTTGAPPRIAIGRSSEEVEEGWGGSIDDVVILLRPLSAAEVEEAYLEAAEGPR